MSPASTTPATATPGTRVPETATPASTTPGTPVPVTPSPGAKDTPSSEGSSATGKRSRQKPKMFKFDSPPKKARKESVPPQAPVTGSAKKETLKKKETSVKPTTVGKKGTAVHRGPGAASKAKQAGSRATQGKKRKMILDTQSEESDDSDEDVDEGDEEGDDEGDDEDFTDGIEGAADGFTKKPRQSSNAERGRRETRRSTRSTGGIQPKCHWPEQRKTLADFPAKIIPPPAPTAPLIPAAPPPPSTTGTGGGFTFEVRVRFYFLLGYNNTISHLDYYSNHYVGFQAVRRDGKVLSRIANTRCTTSATHCDTTRAATWSTCRASPNHNSDNGGFLSRSEPVAILYAHSTGTAGIDSWATSGPSTTHDNGEHLSPSSNSTKSYSTSFTWAWNVQWLLGPVHTLPWTSLPSVHVSL